MSLLTLALSKGRILEESAVLLARAGIAPAGDPERLLRVPSEDPDVSLLIIRPTDVPAYVAYGAADLGIVGKDVLIEHGGEGLYEPLDLGIARCRLSVAGLPPSAAAARHRRMRVATKYPNIAHQHFLARGEQVEVIKLYGSMELAPLVGLADVIVDLVATGNTLRANGLIELEIIRQISARVVVNTASNKLKHDAVARVLARLREACKGLA